MRIQSGVPIKFWADCVQAAAHISNRLPTQTLEGKAPYEVLYNSKPDYSQLKFFGCLVALNPERKHDKFKDNDIPCVFIGYPSQQRGYKILNLINNSVFVSRHVIFYEHIFPYRVSSLLVKSSHLYLL